MTEDIYTIAILVLLPLTAGMLVSQVNPYHALIIRGILGAVAALVYALFGAADVALTEALVGTMLSITLYAVAVRSSMSMRLGVVETTTHEMDDYETMLSSLRTNLRKSHLRLEIVSFQQDIALQAALENKNIHAALSSSDTAGAALASYKLRVRVRRLYEILQGQMSHEHMTLAFTGDLDLSGTQSL
ncbi:MAG: DUF4040 domain-containing protein [Leptolyngbyaceae cyanobacterium]